MSVVTRFAPSPTGFLHAGNYRTAVFAYLYAKHHGGEFIVRIEDTDRERSKPEYEHNILEALSWLELPADKQFRQSEQAGRHRELLEKLISEGTAYVSKEAPKEPGGREEVIRFKNPGGVVTFADVIRGNISIDVDELHDFVIARSLDEPVFHFAVVVDDADEGVTHVIRGEDHISNTPRQILIQRALGFSTPAYAHLPLILGTDRTKLSKRRGAKALTEYRDVGVLPEAMLNYLAFLGWNPGDEREYMSKEELIAAFDLARVHKGSAIFDEVKLRSVNQHWMRKLSDQEFVARGDLDPSALLAVPLLKERAQTFEEARELLATELRCLFETPVPEKESLLRKEPEAGKTATHLTHSLDLIGLLPDHASPEEVKARLMPYADQEGRAAVLWPLRYAL
jgi:glutamyl/glutaminyl-tRNA synthetase